MTNELTKIPIKTVPDLTGATEAMLQIRKNNDSGLDIPTKPYLQWLAIISCGIQFRHAIPKREGTDFHLMPIECDLNRACISTFNYALKERHGAFQIREMVLYLYEKFPSLFYNHKFTVHEDEDTKEKKPVYEKGEVFTAFKMAYTGQLGLDEPDAKVYGDKDIMNLNKIARVMKAYMEYRDPALFAIEDARDKEQKLLEANSEATKEEKEKRNRELVDMQLEELKAKNLSNPSELQIPYYDFFTKYGLMNPTDEDKKAAWQKACDVRVCNAHLKAIDCVIPEIRDHYASVINDAGEPNFEIKDKAMRRLQNDYINTVVLAQKIMVWEFVTGRDVMTLTKPYCRLNFRLSTEYLNSKY